MRILQIGVGKWGMNHLRNWASMRNIEISIAELNKEKHESIRNELKKYGLENSKISTNLEELLNECDAVDIVTELSSHYDLCKIALEAKKDVFIEKPFTTNSKEAKELTQINNKNGKIVQVGHIYRFSPVIQYLKKMKKTGDLGELIYLEGTLGGFKRPRTDIGGMHADGVHYIDLAIMLFEKLPNSVTAKTIQYLSRNNDKTKQLQDDRATAILYFDENKIAEIRTDYFIPGIRRELFIIGSKKRVKISDLVNQTIEIYSNIHEKKDSEWITTPEEIVMRPNIKIDEPLRLELQGFIDCIKTRNKPEVGPEEAYNISKIVEAIYKSSELDRRIDIEY